MVSWLRLEVAMRIVATSTTEAQVWTGIILSDEVAPARSHWLTWLNGEQQSLTQSREGGNCHEWAFRGTQETTSRTMLNGIKGGVSRLHQTACVCRAPDNSDIILIFSVLHVAGIWGFFATASVMNISILTKISPSGIDRKCKEDMGLRLA